jgi:hypothetical protein
VSEEKKAVAGKREAKAGKREARDLIKKAGAYRIKAVA